ncbi:MAG: hypothetical protein JSY10_29460 [Paenibacillus sp.]|nr:hypothetical protein [Paenibacillus sp.]
MECKDKIKGYELLKRHYNKRHTSSILCNNKRNFTEFTFEEGCERQGIEAKKSKAVHLVKGVGMVPTMLSLLDEDENNVYHLYNTIEEVKARKIQDLKLFEKDLTCQLKIYNNNSSESSDKVEIVPSRVLYFYDFPAFNEKMGEYIVIDEEIECKLNKKKARFFFSVKAIYWRIDLFQKCNAYDLNCRGISSRRFYRFSCRE